MNCNIGVKFNNNYHVELIDSITGKLKQHGDFDNIAVIGVGDFLAMKTYTCNMFYKLALGSGSKNPSYSDTALSSNLFSVTGGTTAYEWIDDYTLKGVNIYTFPATSSYVGTVREAGLFVQTTTSTVQTYLATHALFTDSEGQPISFEKTDLDILIVTVTVEASIVSSDDSFSIFKRCGVLRGLLGQATRGLGAYPNYIDDLYGRLTAFRFIDDTEAILGLHNGVYGYDNYDPLYVFDISIKNNVPLSSVTRVSTASETYFSIPKYRLSASSVKAETYLFALALPGLGYWKLPNSSTLPAYTIEGIDIGTGDGSTVNFNNPLSYFKANTDKVYKNGIQLTRGVDYTINNVSNINRLPEIAQLIKPISAVSGYKNDSEYFKDCVAGDSDGHWAHNIAVPFVNGNNYIKDIDTSKECYGFDVNNPIYIEYENAETFNFFRANSMLILKVRKSDNRGQEPVYGPTGTIYVDYSTDGEEYTNIASGNLSTYSYDGKTYSRVTIDFNDTTAKYWRIRTNYSYSSTSYVQILTSRPYNFKSTNQRDWAGMVLGKRDPYITFTTPPAAGDVLTMDVDMDVIFKNSNFVVDATERIDFSV